MDSEKTVELKEGIYLSIKDEIPSGGKYYFIAIKVVNREKTYLLELVEIDSKYDAVQVKDMFSKSKQVIINKNKSNKHTLLVWGDTNFTLYPYQLGTPYYFTLVDDEMYKIENEV